MLFFKFQHPLHIEIYVTYKTYLYFSLSTECSIRGIVCNQAATIAQEIVLSLAEVNGQNTLKIIMRLRSVSNMDRGLYYTSGITKK